MTWVQSCDVGIGIDTPVETAGPSTLFEDLVGGAISGRTRASPRGNPVHRDGVATTNIRPARPSEVRAASVDTGALYERIRLAFITMAAGLTDAQLRLRVPATPAWRARDVLAHVAGLAADLNAQHFPELDDVGGVAWACSQVARRQSMAVAEMIDEWDRQSETFENGLRAFGYEFGSHFVADLHAHYHDVRGAVGLPAHADDLAVAVALDHYLGFIGEMLGNAEWGTLEVVAAQEIRRLGTDQQARARVRAEPFELLRAVSGRRSARQIRALDWTGDVDGFVMLLHTGFSGGYSLPAADLAD
jgi:hypothetical protein